MKTIELNLYTFKELSKEAQQKAIEDNRYFNVDHEWWNCTYDDASTIGLEVTGFDLDRDKHCTGKLTQSGNETAFLILDNHGDECDTYKLAKTFDNEWSKLVKKYSDGVTLDKVAEEREYDFDVEADTLEHKFLKDLLNLYANMLQKEYEYLLSDESVKQSLIANEYDFLETGKRY